MVASHADDAFGSERDASGLMRDYDPALGTFVSPD